MPYVAKLFTDSDDGGENGKTRVIEAKALMEAEMPHSNANGSIGADNTGRWR